MGSILSIDYGLKRIGVAFSDPTRTFAFPLGNIENKNFNYVLSKIENIIKEKEIDLIIVGMPLNMDQTKGEMAIKVESFVKKLKQSISLSMLFFDERLSSFSATERLKERGLSEKKIKEIVDKETARLLLEEFILSEV